MAGIARSRLTQERKNWRKDHPYSFVAKPETRDDGSSDILVWQCIIPGKKGGIWEGGFYPVVLKFSEEYPEKPPQANFPQHFFHPNVYPSGKICLSILNEEKGWRPSLSVKQILQGIQDLLDNPNNGDPAQEKAYHLLLNSKAQYELTVKKEGLLPKDSWYTT
ncbi:SUMO-conjugating enzyme sce1 [Cymbomonas tetramitiformis]|uniref:SUMO-conjugating enzyme UBC9 n=1 Tax=Cymbomonas tetramitiformis TaxID=36881 RepID=A0AAE0FUS0_9CHLO|nr:SUMO-conjugating enzyme sce1 [Cymbomonas tetramitiformis]